MFMDHRVGRTVLLSVAAHLDELQVPFFLMQGTALGAYRDHGFVPTERDIDLGILYEQLWPRAGDIVKRLTELRCELEVWVKPYARPRTIVAWLNGVKIELVGLMRWRDKRFTTPPIHPSVTQRYALVHEADILEEQTQIPLFERSFNIPLRIETYLEREYGPDWRTPKDDHVSRTRIYDFCEANKITDDEIMA